MMERGRGERITLKNMEAQNSLIQMTKVRSQRNLNLGLMLMELVVMVSLK
jgi:hypothetical protein